MEPRIRYAKTSDGVSIAYFSVGDGRKVDLKGVARGAASVCGVVVTRSSTD